MFFNIVILHYLIIRDNQTWVVFRILVKYIFLKVFNTDFAYFLQVF